jgi:hypothetical protein
MRTCALRFLAQYRRFFAPTAGEYSYSFDILFGALYTSR